MMKDIDDMKIGESFYLKRTVAVISTRTGKPCEFDEERIDVNALIIEELKKIREEISKIDNIYYPDLSFNETGDCYIHRKSVADVIDNHISELKGE